MSGQREGEHRLLHLLEQLLEIDPEDSEHALDEAATAIAPCARPPMRADVSRPRSSSPSSRTISATAARLHGYARGPRSTGLGIGLYLAERIASAHGGRLRLDSTPAGATFTLRLPTLDEASPEEPSLVYTDENGARDDRMRS